MDTNTRAALDKILAERYRKTIGAHNLFAFFANDEGAMTSRLSLFVAARNNYHYIDLINEPAWNDEPYLLAKIDIYFKKLEARVLENIHPLIP